MGKRIALGKGIASLIQDTPQEILSKSLKENFGEERREDNGSNPYMVKISEIMPNPDQPRKIFNSRELEELANSIRENGVIQPLIVSKIDGGKFSLIAGERRLKASKLAGLEDVPVVIKKATEKERMVMAIIENVQRADLNCVEEAIAYYRLMNDYDLTQEEVAKKLGKERSSVANFLRILKLPKQILEMVQKDLLSFGHAKILASVKEPEKALRLANKAATDKLTVRELENLMKKSTQTKTTSEKSFDAKIDALRQRLEQKTGFHFALKRKAKGNGEISIKFSNDAEFNDIYDYLTRN